MIRQIKRSGFHYNLSLKHKKKTGKDVHIIKFNTQKECAKTHQANEAPQASKATQIKCKCKEFKKRQRQPAQKYSIDHKCFAISRFFGTLWVT